MYPILPVYISLGLFRFYIHKTKENLDEKISEYPKTEREKNQLKKAQYEKKKEKIVEECNEISKGLFFYLDMIVVLTTLMIFTITFSQIFGENIITIFEFWHVGFYAGIGFLMSILTYRKEYKYNSFIGEFSSIILYITAIFLILYSAYYYLNILEEKELKDLFILLFNVIVEMIILYYTKDLSEE